ncbi:MAG: hypothetical protein LQ348_005541 [Seirophora lacunosa]|nr:MAG: hypothetical protein LQ348_005541 [Seirophora lacunosa]
MSSSQQFIPSSPLSPTAGHSRKSRFTFKQLSQLALSSTTSPLRVIAHIDLDAFYAQCEGVRLGIAEDQPLAVQQWQGLIAINYPARKYGLSRHITITEAKKLCPNMIMQHVATWKEGDAKWAYHEDAFAQIATHKVSLDPYRLESRRILACIKDVLPPSPVQKVEKASVDEVFLDLSAQIHSILLERYPELKGSAPYDDPTERLPRPPTTALDWNTDALVDLDHNETEDDDPDWDDITMLIGSEIVRSVRAAIRERLKYTCSAGIARNKMIAKLGSAHKKPNQQTIVRNRAVQQFMGSFKFTKIRNLGGKLGEDVVSKFGTEQVQELLNVSLGQLKSKLGDDTGSWVYEIIRGEDTNEVNSRTQIKSMLSAKSFRPTINSYDQAVKWLRIFVADIFARLVEEGILENKRRPKTVNLHHRQGGQMRSRQAPIPSGRPIDENVLYNIAKTLLGQVIVDGRAWPCANLQLSVGGFEEGPTGNRGIGGFLVRGDEAKAVKHSLQDSDGNASDHGDGRPDKRPKSEQGAIQRFLSRKGTSHGESDEEISADHSDMDPMKISSSPAHTSSHMQRPEGGEEHKVPSCKGDSARSNAAEEIPVPKAPDAMEKIASRTYFCKNCHTTLQSDTKNEHEDWHFAKSIAATEKATGSGGTTSASQARIKAPKKINSSRSNATPAQRRIEKGQSRLAFG